MYSLLNTAKRDVNIIIIQKLWLSRDDSTISYAFFYTYIAKHDENERARTAIYVSNVHKHFTVNIRNDIIHDGDVQIIHIHTSNEVFRIYNVYNEKRDNIYIVQRILQTYSFENRVKIILVGDF